MGLYENVAACLLMGNSSSLLPRAKRAFGASPLNKVLKRTGLHARVRVMYRRLLEHRSGSRFSDLSEQAVLDDLLAEVRAGDVVWDVGAAFGLYSQWLAFEGAEVFAFEPHPRQRQKLLERLGPWASEVSVQPYALGQMDGDIEITADGADGPGSPAVVTDKNNGDTITATISRGDAVDCPTPRIVKIDVEGAELGVLEGLGDRVEDVELFYIEVHDEAESAGPSIFDYGATPKELESFLESHGFEIVVIQERERDRHIKACNTRF